MNKTEILTQALAGRDDEVLGYQVNIDNYRLAIAHIDAMPQRERVELHDFKQQLEALLATERLEQKKAMVMQAVIKQQLEA